MTLEQIIQFYERHLPEEKVREIKNTVEFIYEIKTDIDPRKLYMNFLLLRYLEEKYLSINRIKN